MNDEISNSIMFFLTFILPPLLMILSAVLPIVVLAIIIRWIMNWMNRMADKGTESEHDATRRRVLEKRGVTG